MLWTKRHDVNLQKDFVKAAIERGPHAEKRDNLLVSKEKKSKPANDTYSRPKRNLQTINLDALEDQQFTEEKSTPMMKVQKEKKVKKETPTSGQRHMSYDRCEECLESAFLFQEVKLFLTFLVQVKLTEEKDPWNSNAKKLQEKICQRLQKLQPNHQ